MDVTARSNGPNWPAAPDVEIALLDLDGVIVSVNQAWRDFAIRNGADPATTWVGQSYLAACDAAGADDSARQVRAAVELALASELSAPVTVEIPCDSPSEARWFDVLVSSRFDEDHACVGATVTLSRSTASRRPDNGNQPVEFPDRPRAEMERLVGELAERVTEVVTAQARMRLLLAASSSLATEAHVTALLDRMAELASELIGARQATVRRSAATDNPPETHDLALPIEIQGNRFGTLYLSGNTKGHFDAEDEWLATALTAIAAIAIDNALLRADGERRRRWQTAIVDGLRALTSANPIESLDQIAKYAAIGAPADGACILAAGDEAATVVGAYPPEAHGLTAMFDGELAASVLRSNEPAIDSGGRAMWAPLLDVHGSTTAYALAVARPADGEPFEPADLEQLAVFSQQLAFALEHSTRGSGS